MRWVHALCCLIYHHYHICSSWAYRYRLPFGNIEPFIINAAVCLYVLICVHTYRVGNSLGSGQPGTARLVSRLGCVIGVAMSIITGIILYFARRQLASLFSGDDGVIGYVLSFTHLKGCPPPPMMVGWYDDRLSGDIMPILVLYQIGDVLQTVFQGVFRGCGRQRIGNAPSLYMYHWQTSSSVIMVL